MKCWTFLALQVLISAAEDTSVAPQQNSPPHPHGGVQRGGGHDTNTYGVGEDPYGIGSSAKSPQLRSCKFPEREIRLYAANGNVRVLPNENVTHGTVLRFHCRPLGETRLEGNESSQCMNGRWSNQVPRCLKPHELKVVIRLKDTEGTAVSPDGYLYIKPRSEVEMECESYYYPPRLEMIEPVSSWKMGGVRSIRKSYHGEDNYVSAKFSLPEDYEGIVRCPNDTKYYTQIIKIRGRDPSNPKCKVLPIENAVYLSDVNNNSSEIQLYREFANGTFIYFHCRGDRTSYRIRCLEGFWKPTPRCPPEPPHPDVGVQRGGGHDTTAYRASEDPYEIGSSAKSPPLRSCKFPERKMSLYAANGNVRVLPNENVAYGTGLRFHCRPLGQIRLEGDKWSRCINGTWSNELPYCYEPGKFDVVIHLKDTAGTAVSPDGFLNIDPRFEVKMECESYYYHPRLEMMEPVSSWKRGGVRSILKTLPWKNHYMSAKFSLPEDYWGIVRCSNDNQYPTQIIKIRGRSTPAPGCDLTDFFTAAPSPVVINASASEVPLGAVFEAFCDDKGYILEGPSSRVTCKANGMWDFDPKMTCVKGCPNFADQDERLVIEGFLPKYYLGDSITLSCPYGTKLDPHVERITCLRDGWSETELPRCSDTE